MYRYTYYDYMIYLKKFPHYFQRYKMSEIASVPGGQVMRNKHQEMDCHVHPY